jgi:A/G-specific adenine glycosylase
VLHVPPDARDAILAWFDARGRSFPFRGVRDPWAILVSETMAQQTQIARASAKWEAFMVRFPTVHAVAAAAPGDVLREWRGLGYNRRALNLWRAARVVVDEHGAQLPDSVDALERLPGVGPYTARAVAALAYGRPVGAVDTNVRRVLTRMIGAELPLDPRALQSIADASVPGERPGDWTHALMDVGATLCRPATPVCADCPARRWCAYASSPPSPPSPPPQRRRTANGPPAFQMTSRWLRGHLIDALRDGRGGAWVAIGAPFGCHEATAVEAALEALARDGVVERHPTEPRLARLPLG